MTDDVIDQLYAVAPDAFTALRAELVAAAKKRGDQDEAKRIGAARRPTTAAWVVNALIHGEGAARDRLIEHGEKLRAAHAAMDGARIRALSSSQRTLIDDLVRAGFRAAGLPRPSAAIRDDVVGTLQAAIADPEVAARLGRLSKAERWSGFGEFGAVTAVGARGSRKPAKVAPSKPRHGTEPNEDEVATARERVAAARGEVQTAESKRAEAVDALAERTSRLATARRRYEKLLDTLSAAERELNNADTEHGAAERSARSASDAVKQAKALLGEAESKLAALGKSRATRET